jgi:hypothetical protein
MCVRVLTAIAKQPKSPPTARVQACGLLLERGWGKPAQPVTGADGEGDIRITIRQILDGTPDKEPDMTVDDALDDKPPDEK